MRSLIDKHHKAIFVSLLFITAILLCPPWYEDHPRRGFTSGGRMFIFYGLDFTDKAQINSKKLLLECLAVTAIASLYMLAMKDR